MRMVVVLALVLVTPLTVAAASECAAPAAMSDGWPVASPATEGLDPSLICSIGSSLEKLPEANPDGVVVVRHGTLVYEHYFADSGMHYNADAVHAINSITKSVVALLAGIAFDRGWLKSIDDPVLPYLPNDADLRAQGKDRITLRDMLTMTSGLAWPESAISYADPSNIERQMGLAPDPYRFVLTQPLVATPGTVWNYNSGGVEVLGDISAKVSHQPLDQFAQQVLLDPLGISHSAWLRFPDGKISASSGLWLQPRDLAKIGQLVLNDGMWHRQRIVSAQWIADMIAAQVPRPSSWPRGAYGADSYGYLWWLGRLAMAGRNVDWIAGIGWGGQRLYVVPSRDLVVAVTASNDTSKGRQYLTGDTALGIVLHAAGTR